MSLHAMRLSVPASLHGVQDHFHAQGWTDGLPVVPPTPELVEEMVRGSGLPPDMVLGRMPPSMNRATVERIAINAVMAGCLPVYMPVIVAAIRALLDPVFNLAGVQCTTHPVAPFLLVNGPVRAGIGLNSGANAFGQGSRANATIGRAVRLVLMNVGGGIPGQTDMATLGSPCKFAFCAGENEERSPWEPFHVSRGFAASASAVTVHAAEGPHNVQDHASDTAGELLQTIADTMNTTGSNNVGTARSQMMVILAPEHARILAAHGLSRRDVSVELHGRMRLSMDRLGSRLKLWYRSRRAPLDVGPEVAEVNYLAGPDQILVAVIGGHGLHSAVIPSFGDTSNVVTQEVTDV